MTDAPRLPRRRRVVPAAIVASVLAAGAITVVVDIISVAVNHRALIWPYEQMAARMRSTHWSDIPIMAIASAAVAIGVLLLLSAVVPGRQKLVPLVSDRPGESAGISPRSLRRTLSRTVSEIDGVDHIDVNVRPRKVRVTIGSALPEPGPLSAEAETATAARLGELRLARSPSVDIRVKPRKAE